MFGKVSGLRVVVAAGAMAAMLGLVACGGADEETAPAAPAAAPVIDTGAIQAAVRDAVAASVPESSSAEEIKTMVEAAVAAASSGVTPAQMEAAVSKSVKDASKNQLTAAEIQAVVDASIKALPAPKVDSASLKSLINESITASVPKGTSAEEIQTMVEAAVTAATADVATRGDMEAAIAKSVSSASAGQLTAAEVQKIVDASTAATVKAAEDAAVAAAMAAVPSLGEIIGGLAPITDKERTKPEYLAKISSNGLVSLVYEGPAPTKFNEAPLLAELVKAGKLPPVEERLPDEPAVIPVHEAIGKYGGTWRRFYTRPTDHGSPRTTILGDWDSNGLDKIAIGLKSYDFSNGGRTITYNMRPGMKWSDGNDYTSEDFVWTYENIFKNTEYNPNLSGKYKDPITDAPMIMEAPDDYTVTMTYESPYYGWLDRGNMNTWDTHAPNCWAPYHAAHYLQQFHPVSADATKLAAMIKEVEGTTWVDLMKRKCNGYSNLEIPTLNAWVAIDDSAPPQWIFQRNPYYWAVDPAGNQLPYLDHVIKTMIEDTEVINLKAISGEVDLQGRHIQGSYLPLLQQYTDRGGYRLQIYPSPSPSDWGFNLNQSYEKDELVGNLLRTRDFRRALGLAVDREEIKEIRFVGAGNIRNFAPAKGSLFDPGDEWRNWDVKRDVKQANALLDGIGSITEKDSDGYRLRSDTGGRLVLYFETFASQASVVELMIQHYKDVGITLELIVDPKPYLIHRSNEGYMGKIAGGPGWNCWITAHSCSPRTTSANIAVEVGRWYATDGDQGEDPSAGTKYQNEDGRFIMQELADNFSDGAGFHMTSPERLAKAKFAYSTYNKESLALNFIGGTGEGKGLFVVNQDMRNVPDPRMAIHAGFFNQPPRMDIYYYENPDQHLHYQGQ